MTMSMQAVIVDWVLLQMMQKDYMKGAGIWLYGTYWITNIGVHGDQDRVSHKEEGPESKF